MRGRPPKSLEERFWSRVLKTNRCWLWTGLAVHDYGQLSSGGHNGKKLRAHRVSWAIHYGEIPDGMWVLHRCDTPLCVRPDHLFLGSAADNAADRDAKGRGAAGERNGMYGRPAFEGENHPMARLTADQVREIRRLYGQGGITQTKLAQMFGVHQTTISDYVRRGTWRSI